MKLRLISTIGLIVLLLTVALWAPASVCVAGIWVFLFLGMIELWQMQKRSLSLPLMLIAGLGGAGVLMSEGLNAVLVIWLTVVLFFMLYILQNKDLKGANKVLMGDTFGFLYLFGLGFFLAAVRLLPDGAFWLIWVILTIKAGDIGAYIVGRTWGKTPLWSHVSPKKTWEGAIAHLVFSISVGLFIFKNWGPLNIPIGGFVFFIAAINIVSQLGDYYESVLKRDADIKDSGGLLPGIGGVLDLLDSLLLPMPLVYLYLTGVVLS